MAATVTVIDLLNQARARELTVITQYMAQHYELEDAGYGKLGDRLKAIAIVEMQHAESLAERILFLGGVPVTKPDDVAKIKQEVPQLLATDISLEDQTVKLYNQAAETCGQLGDHVTRALFAKLAEVEEEHLNEFQNTADHAAKLGAAYLATLIE
jgi:bacterioferritin